MMKGIQRAYDILSRRKGPVVLAVAALLVCCLWAFFSTPIRADIRTMMPEGHNGRLARDFTMLAQSSLSSNVFITIKAEDAVPQHALAEAADSLAASLAPPHFRLIDPDSINPIKALEFLLNNARSLVSEDDIEAIAEKTTPSSIRTSLESAVRQLLSPQGIATKRIIRHDPLGFSAVLAPRLEQLKSFSNATVQAGHLFSKDGTAILITARSDISMTDADGSAELIHLFKEAKSTLPPGIKATLISGHVHTVANATTIQDDLITISLIAFPALVLLFILFFRSTRALGVFLTPLAAMACALGALALFNQTISAIVIGFGVVLIGISIDFAMHVHFAIARNRSAPGKAIQAVSRPILFCGLTSCAAFGSLFYSGIPGIRQLALFSIAGLAASILFSLFVLPLMSTNAKTPDTTTRWLSRIRINPRLALVAWGGLIAASLWLGTTTSLDPDLRTLGHRPESLEKSEREFAALWGDVRGRAVVFAHAENLQDALDKNDAVYDEATQILPDTTVVSLSPLMPSKTTQAHSNQRWDAFWTPDSVANLTDEIARQGKALGFSNTAFVPFSEAMAAKTDFITPMTLDNASLGLVRDMFMPESTTGVTLTTFFPDDRSVRDFFSPEREAELGVRLVSTTRFKNALEETMSDDIKQFITISGCNVFILCFLLFRNARRSCLAVMPAITGLAAVFGVLGLTGTDLNLFHITALPLVIGLGTDYGIFLVSRETTRSDLSTLTAVTASGLTTLAGFGVLALALHPSLNSMGVTVLVGVGAALVCALFIMPGLVRSEP